MTETATPERILQTGLGFWASKTLLSAVEIGVFTELARRPQSLTELSHALALHPRSAADFLDALVALRFLQKQGEGNGLKYTNTPDAALFLDRNKDSYVGGMLEMANMRLYPFWANLTEALRTGEPQNEIRDGGLDPFSRSDLDNETFRGFIQAMTGLSMGSARALAHTFAWERYHTFADVGTAQGGLPVVLVEAHPHLRGIGVDLPKVQSIFEEYVRRHELQDRIQWCARDIWSEPFPQADVIVLGHMLHGWGLERKKVLLQKAFDALPVGGAVLAYDAVIDDQRRENAFGLLFSLNMLIENREGAEYTGAECEAWMRDIGFSSTYVKPLVGAESVVVGVR
jgi:O-methyltransferase/methyltransferase family protein